MRRTVTRHQFATYIGPPDDRASALYQFAALLPAANRMLTQPTSAAPPSKPLASRQLLAA